MINYGKYLRRYNNYKENTDKNSHWVLTTPIACLDIIKLSTIYLKK